MTQPVHAYRHLSYEYQTRHVTLFSFQEKMLFLHIAFIAAKAEMKSKILNSVTEFTQELAYLSCLHY